MKKLFLVFIISFLPDICISNTDFRHITDKDGLGYSWVWDIYQDRNGYIWISTIEGAYRYNGYDFERLDLDPTPVSYRAFFTFEDSKGYLWIGTNRGLMQYDREFSSTKLFSNNKNSDITISSSTVLDMVEDRDGNLWIATPTGLNRYNPFSGENEIFFHSENQNTVGGNAINTLLIDTEGTLWVGCNNGSVSYYDNNNQCFENLCFENVIQKGDNRILTMTEDGNNRIWIGTDGSGAIMYDKKKKVSKRLLAPQIANNIVRAICEDHDKKIWIGTEKGISILSADLKQYETIRHEAKKPKGLNDNAIYSIMKDADGDMWIGTFFGGLNVKHQKDELFDVYQPSIAHTSISGRAINTIYEHNNKIWICTEDNGISIFNPRKKMFDHINTSNSNLSFDNTHAISIDKNNNLWIGTFSGGLNISSQENNKFKHYDSNNTNLDDNIYSIFEDSKDNIWVGTQTKGLFKYDQNKQFHPIDIPFVNYGYVWDIIEDKDQGIWFAEYYHGLVSIKDTLQNKISSLKLPIKNAISLFYDKPNTIYVCTEQNGLGIYNITKDNYKILNKSVNFPVNTIYAITKDRNNHLWFSSNNGLYKTDSTFTSFTNYTVDDGLPTNRFNYNSVLESKGKLYFGSTNGLVVVHPEKELPAYSDLPIHLDHLYISNVRQDVCSSHFLKKNLDYCSDLEVDHKSSTLGLDFSVNSFSNTSKIKYAYKMVGISDSWVYIGEKRRIDFTNLNPGNYTLYIRTLGINDELQENERVLSISIIPPWWKTVFAKTIYILLFTSLISFIVYILLARTKAKHALDIAELERESEHEMNEIKLRFFTNISHEFKTPLSLIIGPLEQIINKKVSKEKIGNYLNIVKNNADNLLNLINELIEFREVQNKNALLLVSEVDINTFLLGLINNFNWMIEEKEIDFSYKIDKLNTTISADKAKLEKIINNLISNAFKYTPSKGKIHINVKNSDNMLRIEVKNSDTTISQDKLSQIFNRFYTNDSQNKFSSGIGLAYVKSLVALHSGSITVSSNDKEGVCFTVSLPQIAKQQIISEKPIQNIPLIQPTTNLLFRKVNILVVEDEDDLRHLIADSLSDDFKITTASSAEEALHILETLNFQIIITDVMMGEINGFELCQKIKNNIELSHIKVILLTALSERDFKTAGYKSGADAYISKPFSFEYLRIRIQNLLRDAFILQENYKTSSEVTTKQLTTSSPDELFLEKAIHFINQELDNLELDTEMLMNEMGMSQSSLYRKLKAISGQSPNSFIQNVRLKCAAEMLLQGKKNVSEVAYSVGFSDPYYFSKCFKRCFGVAPSKYTLS